MNNAIIFHGTGGSPESFWFPYVKQKLEDIGFKVWVPQLPNPNDEKLSEWLPFALKNGEYNAETTLIGHSSGCPLILSILEKLNQPIKKAILVSGFSEPLSDEPKPILQEKYDWEKIKSNCKDFIFINSDNDPWGCNDKASQKMFDQLDGTQVIRHGEGHMGSEKFNQSYKEFSFLLKFID